MGVSYSGAGGAGSPTIKIKADGGTVSGITTITPDPIINFVAGAGVTLTGTTSNTIKFSATGGGGGISGTIADTQVAYGTAADTIGGDANFTWDSSRELLMATYSTLANVYEVVADVDITKGQAVYTTGFNGGSGKPTVDLAQANSSSTMPAIGIAAANILAGQTGLVIIDGELKGITTSGSQNDILYVSATVAGAITNSRPTGATELVQNVGNIIKVGVGGKIAVTTTGRTNDVPNSFSISGSISAGSLNLTTPLAVANGGTGATTATTARNNLGIYSGLDTGITINNGRNTYTIDIQSLFGSILTANSVIQITLESGGVIGGDTLICWMDNFDTTPGSNSITVIVEANITSPPGPYTGNIHYTIIL